MTEPSTAPGTTPVTDRRPVPSGTVPRRAQTWLMAAIALGMLVIILLAGRPEPPQPVTAAGPVPQPTTPFRVREYQDRLRVLDTRLTQEAQTATASPAPARVYDDSETTAPEDPILSDRRRRDYESLFASNVVLSRRPEGRRPDAGRAAGTLLGAPAPEKTGVTAAPSIDDIADAVIRATSRATGGSTSSVPTASLDTLPTADTGVSPSTLHSLDRRTSTEPISAAGPLHRLPEGTLIDTVLTNRLDGGAAAPVNCLVTNAVYSHNRQHVLIPAGARVLGDTKPVQGFGDVRLAVAFHRILMPDGSSVSLDGFLGVNQIGEGGLRDRVNQHYWSTFGAAGAVGLISGFAQYLGTLGFGRGDGDRTLVIAGSASDATAQASMQMMNRFLNRMPGITIREGHRVKVYVTSDLELPAYSRLLRASVF